MTCILCYFVYSCLEQFAQYFQATIDKIKSEELRALLPIKVLDALRSPTGLLRLPPPSAKKMQRSSKSNGVSLAEIPFQSLQLLYLKQAPKREAKLKDSVVLSTVI
jgi:hypothetical protein